MSGLRLGRVQEQRLREWPKDRIRPKSVALGVMSLLAEVDHIRADLARAVAERNRLREALAEHRAAMTEYMACREDSDRVGEHTEADLDRAVAAEERMYDLLESDAALAGAAAPGADDDGGAGEGA